MKFYAQTGEDKALMGIFSDMSDGFFVDVGALDGVKFSNTYLFEQKGWRGICVEPHPLFFKQLVKNRPESVCLQVAVWDKNLKEASFFMTERGSWSRLLRPKMNRRTRTIRRNPYIGSERVTARTLDSILEEHGAPEEFELLSIDTDGHESHVLKGFDLGRWRPRAVVIEYWAKSSHFNMNGDEAVELDGKRVHSSCPDALDRFFYGQFGYQPVWKRTGNLIYCRSKEDAERVAEAWPAKVKRP